MQLIANGIVIAGDQQKDLRQITDHFQPFYLKVNHGKMEFKYGAFPQQNLPLLDAAASYNRPATVRFYFWTNGRNAARAISIKDFKFNPF